LWQGKMALSSTQNIPSSFSNHSWSMYSFCRAGRKWESHWPVIPREHLQITHPTCPKPFLQHAGQ
jgi:hypothetical protein